MQRAQGQILYSPSDLITFMGSPFGSWMDRKALDDPSLKEKMDPEDGLMKTLQGRGYAHEAAYLQKLKADGSSLLPIGMTSVDGDFSRGEVIAIVDEHGHEVARGLANYAAAEARLLCRKPSAQMATLIGYAAEPEMVHRDNMVITK